MVRRSLLAVGENRFLFFFCSFPKTGNSLSVYFRRATTLRAATRESSFQSSPRRAASSAARFCEKDGSADIHHRLNCVPHWTELDRAHSDACFILPPSSSFFWFILWLIRYIYKKIPPSLPTCGFSSCGFGYTLTASTWIQKFYSLLKAVSWWDIEDDQTFSAPLFLPSVITKYLFHSSRQQDPRFCYMFALTAWSKCSFVFTSTTCKMQHVNIYVYHWLWKRTFYSSHLLVGFTFSVRLYRPS